MCDKLLSKSELSLAQIDAIAFGAGPGSFTGLRIAAGVVQGMAFGADLPVIKISTLAALSQQIVTPQLTQSNSKIIAAIDARMQEVYWCVFEIADNGLVIPIINEAINKPDDIAFAPYVSNNANVYAIGSGWKASGKTLLQKKQAPESKKVFSSRLTSAKEIGLLAAEQFRQGNVVSAADAIPLYLRNNVARKTQDNQRL